MASKQKIIKPDYKRMGEIVKICSSRNMGRAVAYTITVGVLSSIFYASSLIPMLPVANGTEVSLGGGFLTVALFLIACVASFVLFYGLMSALSRMVEGRDVTIGQLFSGFRQGHGEVLKASLFLTALLFVILIIFSVVMAFLLPGLVEKTGREDAVTIFGFVFMLISLIVFFPFVFVCNVLHHEKNAKLSYALKKSFSLVRGRYFNILGFCLYSGGITLIVAVVCILILFLTPESRIDALNFIVYVIGIAGLFFEYAAAVKIFMSIPVYYYSMEGLMRVSEQNECSERSECSSRSERSERSERSSPEAVLRIEDSSDGGAEDSER